MLVHTATVIIAARIETQPEYVYARAEPWEIAQLPPIGSAANVMGLEIIVHGVDSATVGMPVVRSESVGEFESNEELLEFLNDVSELTFVIWEP